MVLLGSAGCGPGTLAKRALHEAAGASADVHERAARPDLAGVGGVELAKVTNTAGRLCPGDFLREFRSELDGGLRSSDVLRGGESSAALQADLVHYEDPNTLGSALSPFHQGVALVTLLGPDGGELAKLTVVGKSEAMRTGPTEVAKAMAAKLVEYLERCKQPGDEEP